LRYAPELNEGLSPPWNGSAEDAADSDDAAKRQQEYDHAKPFSLSTPSLLVEACGARLTPNCKIAGCRNRLRMQLSD
jgi:hypothetical protein